jgi:hypothetical protein
VALSIQHDASGPARVSSRWISPASPHMSLIQNYDRGPDHTQSSSKESSYRCRSCFGCRSFCR